MIVSFIEQAVLLLALCWLLTYNVRLWDGRPWARRLVSGLLYGSMTIVCMWNSYAMAPGVLLDARDVVLAMAGLFGGPVVGVMAGLMAAAYRWWLGGVGAPPGILLMAWASGAGLVLRYLIGQGWLKLNIRSLLLLSLVIYGGEQLSYLSLPAEIWLQSRSVVVPLMLVALIVLLGLVLQDAQNHRQMELTLSTSEARLRAITGAIPDQLLVIDDEGYYLEVASAAPASRPEESVRHRGRRVQDLLVTAEAERVMAFIRDTLARNTPHSIVYRLDGPGGGRVCEGHAQTLHGLPKGQSAVVMIVRDITERVKAETELRVAAAAFDSSQGMLITDADNRILRVNRQFTEITGYTAAEVLGSTPGMLSSGRHTPAFYQQMWNCIQGTGNWQGEIYNKRKSGEVYPQWLTISSVKNKQGQVSHYVAAISDISQRKADEQQINRLAFYDVLTGLANRRLLAERLKQGQTSGRHQVSGALIYIDLDNFKDINDLWGHGAGDQTLLQVAQRLSNAVRETDTVARLGGDEFAVLLTDWPHQPGGEEGRLEQMAGRLLDTLLQPYVFEQNSLHLSASLGLVLFDSDPPPLEELLQRAELAMYQAKAEGKSRLCSFDADMQAAVTRRLQLEKDVIRGLELNEFGIYLQAQVSEHQGVSGAEALVRWYHPERGLLAPGAFIEVAESAGLMGRIDSRVLLLACEQLAVWSRQPALAELTLSVNLSASELYRPGFVEEVLDVLAQTGANPARLKLELTESMLLNDMPTAIARMTMLKDRGVRFAVDDFGTGYSSLLYLQQLPLDQLKIDQSFVRALPDDHNSLEIVRTIIALARSLGMEVIAEGVETQAQRQTLLASGCHLYQGYLFARPEPAQLLEQMIDADQGRCLPIFEPDNETGLPGLA
ncbi:EAL domain-containing protein [Zobellella maritima]|uniref:EAL domain-containing protein n=1 Tax=Zobellella maritima TaxID=2059725 RepID=UPI000E303F49|nr:EAL domain-containing protein [Zobellella maritima]